MIGTRRPPTTSSARPTTAAWWRSISRAAKNGTTAALSSATGRTLGLTSPKAKATRPNTPTNSSSTPRYASPSLRPMAELSAVVVPFLAARLMVRHQAAVVGRALEVVGGLLVPIMAITSQVDGYQLPRDPKGPALVLSLI